MAATQYLTVNHLTTVELTRLFRKIAIDHATACWNWTGSCDPGGYGHVTFRRRLESTHRLVYAWLVEPLPRGNVERYLSQLDHSCRNRRCCNPAHLERVTQPINMARGESPSALHARKTHCKNGHPLPDDPTPREANPSRRERVCDICRSEYESNRREDRRQYARNRRSGPMREVLLARHREEERIRRQRRRALRQSLPPEGTPGSDQSSDPTKE
jgi:hypothetical protein